MPLGFNARNLKRNSLTASSRSSLCRRDLSTAPGSRTRALRLDDQEAPRRAIARQPKERDAGAPPQRRREPPIKGVSTLTGARLRERGNREPRQVDDPSRFDPRFAARTAGIVRGRFHPGDHRIRPRAHIPYLEHLERDDRGVDQVAQFMREEPEALALACRLSVEGGLISFARVLGDRTRDGIGSRHRFSMRKSSR